MAEKDDSVKAIDKMLDLAQTKRRLDLLDQRLDNIDSVVTALVERIMQQPLSIIITCPHCGKNIEVGIVGNQRPNK